MNHPITVANIIWRRPEFSQTETDFLPDDVLEITDPPVYVQVGGYPTPALQCFRARRMGGTLELVPCERPQELTTA